MRVLLFVLLAASLTAYALWIYRRFELNVAPARRLAWLRVATLLTLLVLLFDLRLPGTEVGGVVSRWVLLDASLSMSAGAGAEAAWPAAEARAKELEADGWSIVRFGSATTAHTDASGGPGESSTLLAPALERAAEAGAREVRVLSDLRFEDPVAVQAALESLPMAVDFEHFGSNVPNAGISDFEVPDALRPEGSITAVVEIHGVGFDSVTVEVAAEGEVVGSRRVAVPAPGLGRRVDVSIPVPTGPGRIRYTASVSSADDGFASDDVAVAFALVGSEEGALVLVSLSPDWEPRFLLPVLEGVTGLSAQGYLRAGDDRYVTIGRALDRTAPVDSAAVRRAVGDAALLVVHGLSGDADAFGRSLTSQAGRSVLMPNDAAGAAFAGLESAAPNGGEWYASGDLPPSPIAGELSGATLLGLPPVTGVLVPSGGQTLSSPLLLQLRGTGAAEAALHFEERAAGRRVVMLSSGFWRWALRSGPSADTYRRLWSGIAGWLLADETAAAPEPRPSKWVFVRTEPVTWRLPGDSTRVRVQVSRAGAGSVDTTLVGATASMGVMESGSYTYRAMDASGDSIGGGRFEVSARSAEMLFAPTLPEVTTVAGITGSGPRAGGRPLRTSPWPYLLVILLLCGEWIARRRTGLR